jgi:hypothetical protein
VTPVRPALRARPSREGLLAVSGLLVLAARPAGAYELLGASWGYMRHPMGEPLQICTAGMPAGAALVVKRAAAVWDYAGFRFTFRPDGCGPDVAFGRPDGVDRVDLGDLPGRALAQTDVFYVRSRGEITECHTRFNARAPWYVGEGRVPSGEFDLFSVALHELGHCLGLLHSHTRPTPAMDPTIGPGVARRRLAPDDRAGERALYGR